MEHKDLTPEQQAIALDRIAEAASNNDSAMSALLAMKYEYGLGVPKDFRLAYKWLKQAAKLGDPWAQFNLGIAYETGRLGNKINLKLALAWFLKADKNGARGAAEKVKFYRK